MEGVGVGDGKSYQVGPKHCQGILYLVGHLMIKALHCIKFGPMDSRPWPVVLA